MEYAKIAEALIELSGGAGNISSVTHCSTRLRLFIRNKSSVNLEQIKKTKPVLGTVFSGDELQIVLGKNLIPIYNEVSKLHENSGAPASAADNTPKGPMTPKERENPGLLDASRKKRVAAGCGLEVADVNRLLKQYEMMLQLTRQLSKGKMPLGLGKMPNLGSLGKIGGMGKMHGFGRKKRLK